MSTKYSIILQCLSKVLDRSQVLVGLEPCLYIIGVSFQPSLLGSNRIEALRKTLVEALGAALLEECIDFLDLLLAREAASAEADHTAEHAETNPTVQEFPPCANEVRPEEGKYLDP